jgi:hypothetical protein
MRSSLPYFLTALAAAVALWALVLLALPGRAPARELTAGLGLAALYGGLSFLTASLATRAGTATGLLGWGLGGMGVRLVLFGLAVAALAKWGTLSMRPLCAALLASVACFLAAEVLFFFRTSRCPTAAAPGTGGCA